MSQLVAFIQKVQTFLLVVELLQHLNIRQVSLLENLRDFHNKTAGKSSIKVKKKVVPQSIDVSVSHIFIPHDAAADLISSDQDFFLLNTNVFLMYSLK